MTNPSSSTLSSSSLKEVTSRKYTLSTNEIPLTSKDVSPELPVTTSNLKSSTSSQNITKRGEFSSSNAATEENISTAPDAEEISTRATAIPATFTPTEENVSTLSTMYEKLSTTASVFDKSNVPLTSAISKESSSVTEITENNGNVSTRAVIYEFSTTEYITDINNISTSAVNVESSATEPTGDEENVSKISTVEVTFTPEQIIGEENVFTTSVVNDVSSSTVSVEGREKVLTTNAINNNRTAITDVDQNTDLTTVTPFITDSITIDIFCPEDDGHFPHPNDRHKFIACVAGHPTVMDCPEDLVYDHDKKYCDYETYMEA